MSLTSKQIDELRSYAKDRKGELAKLITDAADTIEMLSAKLHASQMERSSQYYHDGWIHVTERLPKVNTDVLMQFKENMTVGFYHLGWWHVNTGNGFYTSILISEDQPTAWMPLPEPYKGE